MRNEPEKAMKALHDQSHYEVLEIRRGASLEEIERAYQIAHAAYSANSLATYSVFGERESAAIRERIDEAYRVLSHGEAREAYDLAEQPAAQRESEPERMDAPIGTQSITEELQESGESFRELEAAVEDDTGEFGGSKLRRARLQRGIELDQVANITKVSPANLRHLEEENFQDLPATVYVRGFVMAYARTIGLDPQRVAKSYLERVEIARANQGRSGFLGRS
jgi:flagellar biosynthesis protein FlhG